MGVDIIGIKPTQLPEVQVAHYFEAIERGASKDELARIAERVTETQSLPGVYFHSNWWGWRPISRFCQAAAGALHFEIDFSLWGENSGGGHKPGAVQ